MHTAQVSRSEEYKMIVEKDVAVPTRDGAFLYADVFRPDDTSERVPAILNITIYQKDALWVPPADLEEKANPYMCWEAVNPVWWVPRGYACVRIDARGSGKSPGRSQPSSYEESLDYYDAIEWFARRPWCSGNIGLAGISYHASAQWRVANLQPPSLKAILPWEGRADQYRDQIYHGGIFAMGFITTWHTNQTAHHLFGKSRTYNPDAFRNDMLWECMSHSLDSDYWRRCSAQWEKIKVPVFSVGNWSGFSMHLRGNTEGYMNAASRHKKLRIHTGTHFHPFHSDEGRQDQVRWFDYWLRGIDNGVMKEPPVKLQIRTGGNARPYEYRFENEWPLARTKWTKWFLKADRERSSAPDAVEGQLVSALPEKPGSITYPATVPTRAGIAPASSMSASAASATRTGITFESMILTELIEITGPLMMKLWVSSTSEDMDIFVTLRNVDAEGKDVWERGQHGQPVPLTKGWLRVSHRKLDPARTLPYRPYHAHDERLPLSPGEPVECEVEIWSTCIVLQKGHRLRVDIQPRDGVGSAPYTHYVAAYNAFAENTIYTGGDRASYLLVPIIPAART